MDLLREQNAQLLLADSRHLAEREPLASPPSDQPNTVDAINIPTSKIPSPRCSSGARETTVCTDIIPATGDTEPREGSSLGSTTVAALADTVRVARINIFAVEPIELVSLEHTSEMRLQLTHQRAPDIGTRIRVTIPYEGTTSTKDYIGEYYGHGQEKTTFRLNGELGDLYHGKVLKVAAKPCCEPDLFTKMRERSPCITSRILYSSLGYANNRQQYYCWITERTIPLDRLLKCSLDVLKDRCMLAAILCLVQCAQNGLLISDNNFFNLGVLVNKEEQHCVVVIDGGWREMAEPSSYTKGECNEKIVRKCWRRALEHGVPHTHVKELWESKHTLTEVVEALRREWSSYPYLVEQKRNTEQIEQDMMGEVICERANCTVDADRESMGESTGRCQPEFFRINTPPPETGEWERQRSIRDDSDPEYFGQAFIRHSGTLYANTEASERWADAASDPDQRHQTLMQQPVVPHLPVEALFDDSSTARPLISPQPVAIVYDLDGNVYSQEEFRAYYHYAFEERWAIASHVTQDLFLLAEQIIRKQHRLTQNNTEHDSFEDALDVVSWMWKKDPASYADVAEYPDDALSVLAMRSLKPLWWRADTLRKSGVDMATTEPMIHAVAEDTWQKWRRHFCATELTPKQQSKSNNKQRSIFNYWVHKETGCVHLAQALIKFGARGAKTIDNIIVDVYRAKESNHHREAIRQTHNTEQNEAIELVRHEYKEASCKLRMARKLKKARPRKPSSHDRKLLEQLKAGELYETWYKAREKHHRVRPRSTRLVNIIAGMSDAHHE